ncbi:MAG: amidohydrolase family protein [Gammaproteobacteria bacterium]|nr:amidohydrolase family protein [Gammaproteobacteria bacterium]
MRFRVLVYSILLCLVVLLLAANAKAETTYLAASALVDPLNGELLQNPVVEIVDGQIISVTLDGDIPETARLIDLGGATILPGLADLHVHLSWYATDNAFTFLTVSHTDEAIRNVVNAKTLLMAGFTTVRNTGAGGFSDVSVRNAINEGRIPGPRLKVSGPSLGITGGHCDENLLPKQYGIKQEGIADGPWGVREKVRDNKKYGVDLIKFCATGGVLSKGTAVGARQYTMEEMQAIVDEAHTHGMKVAAHAHGAEGILYAIRAGVDSIEHGSLIDDEGIKLAIKNGTFLTLDIYSTEYILAEGERIGVLPESMEKAAFVHERRNANFRRAVEAGAKIVFGTDSSVIPHGDNAIQFSRMVEHGMTPMQAIQSATTVAAELMEWEGQIGAVSPGYYADIIAVNGNPLDDISVLEEVFFVMKAGVIYKHTE